MTPRLQPLLDVVSREHYCLAELLLVAASLAATPAAPAPPVESAAPEWLPLPAFAEKRGITLEAAKHLARDARYREAFQVVRRRTFGSSARLDQLISVPVPAPSRPRLVEPESRRRGPVSTTVAPARRGRKRVL